MIKEFGIQYHDIFEVIKLKVQFFNYGEGINWEDQIWNHLNLTPSSDLTCIELKGVKLGIFDHILPTQSVLSITYSVLCGD